MELDELSRRLVPFCQHHYDDPEVRVFDVHKMPGHAGFAYGFSVASRNDQEGWFIRLPPPNVQWKGTADVLRQVEVLNALDGTHGAALQRPLVRRRYPMVRLPVLHRAETAGRRAAARCR